MANDWPPTDLLGTRTRTSPDRIAIESVEEAVSWTYAALDERASAVAANLADRAGDRVGLLRFSGPAYAPLLFGTVRAGAVPVPLSPREDAETLAHCLEQADVETLISDAANTGLGDSLLDDVRETAAVLESSDGPRHSGEARDVAETLVMFTSGSTGRPRGVRLTMENLVASATASAFRLGVTPTDRWLDCLPMYHMGGLAPIIRSVLYGTRLVVQSAFDRERTAAAMYDHGITGVSLVPTMCKRLLEAGWDPPASLRTVLLGGGPISSELVTRCIEANIPVCPTYGLTEAASQVATATPAEAAALPDSVGHPLFRTRVRIRGPEGACAVGSIGEIAVAGPTVSPGYIDGTPTMTGDWFHTGDLGFRDEKGRLYVTGRRADRIVTGGENVAPQAVVEHLERLEIVAEAAVVGLPDDEWGERVAAAVVPHDADTEPEDVLQSLPKDLSSAKRPKTVAILESIPRTASGTVDRATLVERLEADGAHFE